MKEKILNLLPDIILQNFASDKIAHFFVSFLLLVIIF
jgi:hypothetical protein